MGETFKFSLDTFEIEELGAHLCGLDADTHNDTDDVDRALYEKFEINFEQFKNIVSKILSGINVGISPLTDRIMIGISDEEKSMWLVKADYTTVFINTVLQWLGANDIKKSTDRFKRTIKNAKTGKPEYDIIVQRSDYKNKALSEAHDLILKMMETTSISGKECKKMGWKSTSLGDEIVDKGQYKSYRDETGYVIVPVEA